jgi:hypothetical protein
MSAFALTVCRAQIDHENGREIYEDQPFCCGGKASLGLLPDESSYPAVAGLFQDL